MRTAPVNEEVSQQTAQSIAIGVDTPPLDRTGAGRLLRAQISVPAASRAVFVPNALGSAASSRAVTALAQHVLESRNDFVFLLGANAVVGSSVEDIDSALLLATRRILVLPDSVDAGQTRQGIDRLLLQGLWRDARFVDGCVALPIVVRKEGRPRANMKLGDVIRTVELDPAVPAEVVWRK